MSGAMKKAHAPAAPALLQFFILYGGLILGVLRYATEGILMPIIAHFFADLTIALLVLWV